MKKKLSLGSIKIDVFFIIALVLCIGTILSLVIFPMFHLEYDNTDVKMLEPITIDEPDNVEKYLKQSSEEQQDFVPGQMISDPIPAITSLLLVMFILICITAVTAPVCCLFRARAFSLLSVALTFLLLIFMHYLVSSDYKSFLDAFKYRDMGRIVQASTGMVVCLWLTIANGIAMLVGVIFNKKQMKT